MTKRWLPIVALVILVAAVIWWEPTGIVRGRLTGESFFAGRPVSYWAAAIVDEDPLDQEQARQALTAGGRESLDVLCALLQYQRGADWQAAEVRWRAAEILGTLGADAEAAGNQLIQALDDADPHVRSIAAANLANLDVPHRMAVPALMNLLDGSTQLAAIRALSEYGPDAQPALSRLLEILADQQLGSEVRWNAARTIGKMQSSAGTAVEALVHHLHDEAPTVREHCAEALGDIGTAAKSAQAALVAALTDPATRVRRDAVRSLGQIGADAERVVPAIKELLTDEEAIVRDAARAALKLIAPDEPVDDPAAKRNDPSPPAAKQP